MHLIGAAVIVAGHLATPSIPSRSSGLFRGCFLYFSPLLGLETSRQVSTLNFGYQIMCLAGLWLKLWLRCQKTSGKTQTNPKRQAQKPYFIRVWACWVFAQILFQLRKPPLYPTELRAHSVYYQLVVTFLRPLFSLENPQLWLSLMIFWSR